MQTDDIRIRPALPHEADRLSTIAKRAKAHWGYSQDLLDLWEGDLTVSPETCNGENIWALEANGAVIGWGEVVPHGNSVLLDDLWIHPDFMGQGFGKQLFLHLRRNAVERGAKTLRIEADPFAAGFYEHMGARVVGELPSTTIPGRSLPLMELDLTPLETTTINPKESR